MNQHLSTIDNFDATTLFYEQSAIQYYIKKIPFAEQGELLADRILKKFNDFSSGIDAFLNDETNVIYPNPYNRNKWGKHRDNNKESHYSLTINNGPKEREKNIAKGLWRYSREHSKKGIDDLLVRGTKFGFTRSVGTIEDFEVPLFSTGKRNIDLVSRSNKDKVFILELKKRKSNETLIRCLLEAYTYSRFLDRVRFRESFGVNKSAKIIICPLIFDDSNAFEELKYVRITPHSSFNQLISQIKKKETNNNIAVEFAVLNSARCLSTCFPKDDANHPFADEWFS